MQSLNLMLPKEERKAMLLRLFNDDSPLIDHNKERNMKPNGVKPEGDAKETAEETKSNGGSTVNPAAEAENEPEVEAISRENGSGNAEL
jgi:multisite-specific tRNA:(cytosine-C5)-methyltransferase